MSSATETPEELYRGISQVIQGELTSLLYTFSDKYGRKINTFIEILLNTFWEIICVLYYDINVFSKDDVSIEEEDRRLKIWQDRIRFYLKGGKAMRYAHKELINEKLSSNERKAVDTLIDKDSDWDSNLLIIDDNFDEFVDDFKLYIFKIVYFFMLGFIYKDFDEIEQIENYIGYYKLNNMKQYTELIANANTEEAKQGVIKEQQSVNNKIRKFKPKIKEVINILNDSKKKIEKEFGEFNVFFNAFNNYIFENRKNFIEKLNSIKPTAEIIKTQTIFNPNAPEAFKLMPDIVEGYIACFSDRKLFDLCNFSFAASASNEIEISRENAFYLCRFTYKMDAFNAFRNMVREETSNMTIRNMVNSMRTFAEMIDVGIPTKYTKDDMSVEREKWREDVDHSNYEVMIQPIPFLQTNIFSNTYMFPIPKISYHVADNLRMIQSANDPKIIKRCTRLINLLDILCMSEDVEIIHNTRFVIQGTTLDNARIIGSPCNEVFKFLFRCCVSSKSYAVNIFNQTVFFGLYTVEQLLQDNNFINFNFIIDPISFARFYQDYCREKNLDWKGPITSKVDIVLSILNLQFSDLENPINKKNFYTLMKYSLKELNSALIEYKSLIKDLERLFEKDKNFYFRLTDEQKRQDIQRLFVNIRNWYSVFINNLSFYVQKDSGVLFPPKFPISIKYYAKNKILTNETIERNMNTLISRINAYDLYKFLEMPDYDLYFAGGYSFTTYMKIIRNVEFPTADIDIHYIRNSTGPYDKAQASQLQFAKCRNLTDRINELFKNTTSNYDVVRITKEEKKNMIYFNSIYREQAIYFPADPCYVYLVTMPNYDFPVYKLNIIIDTGKGNAIDHFMEIFFLDNSDTITFDEFTDGNKKVEIASINRQIVNYIDAYINKSRNIPIKWYKYGRRLSAYFENIYKFISSTQFPITLEDLIKIYEAKNYDTMRPIVQSFMKDNLFSDFSEYHKRYLLYRLANSIKAFKDNDEDTDYYNDLFAEEDVKMEQKESIEEKIESLLTEKVFTGAQQGRIQELQPIVGDELYNGIIYVLQSTQGNVNSLKGYIKTYIENKTTLILFMLIMSLKHYSIYQKDEKSFIFID